MCSFLLLFLLLIVGFDFIQNSNPHWNTEQAESTSATNRTSRLVFAPKRIGDLEPVAPQESQTDAVGSPFQGQQIFATHFQPDHGVRIVALAVLKLPKNQQEASYKVRHLLCALDEWYSSQYTAQTTASASGECQLDGLGRMVPGVGRMGKWRWITSMGQVSIKITVPSQLKKCKIRCTKASQQQERQEQRKGQRRERQEEGQCQFFHGTVPFHAPSDGAPTMAIAGRCGFQPDAYSCIGIDPIYGGSDKRDHRPKKGRL